MAYIFDIFARACNCVDTQSRETENPESVSRHLVRVLTQGFDPKRPRSNRIALHFPDAGPSHDGNFFEIGRFP